MDDVSGQKVISKICIQPYMFQRRPTCIVTRSPLATFRNMVRMSNSQLLPTYGWDYYNIVILVPLMVINSPLLIKFVCNFMVESLILVLSSYLQAYIGAYLPN